MPALRAPRGRTSLRSTQARSIAPGTLQTTNIWLNEIMAKLGPDRQVVWHVLGAVLHALRNRLQIGLAVHLGAAATTLLSPALAQAHMLIAHAARTGIGGGACSRCGGAVSNFD